MFFLKVFEKWGGEKSIRVGNQLSITVTANNNGDDSGVVEEKGGIDAQFLVGGFEEGDVGGTFAIQDLG